MIIVKLMGGLGNQLYQWAFAKALANKINDVPYLDLGFINNNHAGVTKRDFNLDKFPFLSYRILETAEKTDREVYHLSDSTQPDIVEVLEDVHYYLDGYFQKPAYFSKIEEIIKSELRMPESVKKSLTSLYPISEKSVSLHVRRTDYLVSGGYHPVLSVDYYRQAILTIGEYDKIFVFSDDIDWCKNNLDFDRMIFVEGHSIVEDLWLMSLCSNNIIANSSYSWWGAYLNSNQKKTVISPSEWFGPGIDSFVSQRIPNTWKIM